MKMIYFILRNLRPLIELLMKMSYVPTKDVLKNIIIQDKRRIALEIKREKEWYENSNRDEL